MSPATALRTRELTLDDAHTLAALSLRLGLSETPEQWSAFVRRTSVVSVGALADDRIVGYAAGDVRGGFGMAGPVAWLEAFGVELERRGGGVGRTLLSEVLERFARRGAAHVYTLVPVHDQVLAPFFRQVGFRDEALVCLGRSL